MLERKRWENTSPISASSRMGMSAQRARVRRHVRGVQLEDVQRYDVNGPRIGCSEDGGWRRPVAVGLRPADGDDAPAVTGRQSGKVPLRARRDEVSADLLLVLEELPRDDGTDRVAADVFRSACAA